jgi:hypothetical protein
MRRVTAPGISSAEWRWVILFSGLFVAVTLLPYAWALAMDGPDNNWQFMGMLPNPQDGATYLAKIAQGARGSWLFTLPYTPERHMGAAINEFYLLLGHVSRFLGLSSLVMYHISRLVTGFIMYLCIYYLASVIWPRVRPRRMFFAMVGVGSGLGWLALVLLSRQSGPLDPLTLPTDFSIPESIPFYATFVNPHFPLAIGLIALLASVFIVVFRPGFEAEPSLSNGGAMVALLTIALCIVQPQGWIPIAGGLCLYIVVLTWRTRKIPKLELSWISLVILPAIPFFIYYYAVATANPEMATWSEQNVTPSPSPIYYVLGFGLPLLIAIPGMWRAVRHFERDGDRFMLLWFIFNALVLYAPLGLQRRLAIGMIIPIVYFAVRSLEDFWLPRIRKPLRQPAILLLFVFILPSNILTLTLPLFGILNPAAGIQGWQNLPAGYGKAIRWLQDEAVHGEVVLAPPKPSLWIPAYSYQRVVYGHPFETLNAREKLAEVEAWYRGENCVELVRKYSVRYILSDYQLPKSGANGQAGTSDSDATNDKCLKELGLDTAIRTFDGVAVYEIKP